MPDYRVAHLLTETGQHREAEQVPNQKAGHQPKKYRRASNQLALLPSAKNQESFRRSPKLQRGAVVCQGSDLVHLFRDLDVLPIVRYGQLGIRYKTI